MTESASTLAGERIVVVGDSPLGPELAKALQGAGAEVRSFIVRHADLAARPARPVAGLGEALRAATLGIDITTAIAIEKRAVVQQIDEMLPVGAPLLAFALPVSATEIASWCTDPARVCGFGFIPPFLAAKLVEIAGAAQTGDAARQAAERVFGALDRETAQVGDGAGLVAARVLAAIINEAAYALMTGVASAQDIDAAVRLGVNYPHGPLEWADLIGVDLVFAIIKGVHDETADDRYRPAPLLKRMVLAGHTGRMAGRGFFEYS